MRKQYLNIIFKRYWIIIIIPLIAAIATAVVNYYILEPVYECSTTLYVINKNYDSKLPVDYYGIMAGQLLVKDYREIIKSRTVMDTVIRELELSIEDPRALAKQITVNLKNDTRLIEIKVQALSPKEAKDLAETVSTVFIKRILDIMKVDNISIVDNAEVPLKPGGINPLLLTVISFALGILAAISLAFLMEYFDETIRTVEDVEKNLGLTVMATIPSFNIK